MAYTATGRTRRHYLRKREKAIEEQEKISLEQRNTLPESTGPSALKGNKRLLRKPKTSSNTVPGILVRPPAHPDKAPWRLPRCTSRSVGVSRGLSREGVGAKGGGVCATPLVGVRAKHRHET